MPPPAPATARRHHGAHACPAASPPCAQSAAQILVSWTASTDASGIGGYRVFRNGGATPVATVQTTNYTDNGLAAANRLQLHRECRSMRRLRRTCRRRPAAVSATTTARRRSAVSTPSIQHHLPGGRCAGHAVSLAVQRVFPNLPNFTQPIAMLQEPGNSARWYVVQKTGSVRVFDNTPNVVDHARVHQPRVASELRSQQLERRARPARHGLPSELPDRSARVSLLHRHRPDARPRGSRLAIPAAPMAAPRSISASELDAVQRRRSGEQPQRRQHRLRPGWLPLHRHR